MDKSPIAVHDPNIPKLRRFLEGNSAKSEPVNQEGPFMARSGSMPNFCKGATSGPSFSPVNATFLPVGDYGAKVF
jgi:hypothetical protein